METFFFPVYSDEVADSSERGHTDAINGLIPIHHRLLPLAGCASPARHAAHYHAVLLTHDLWFFLLLLFSFYPSAETKHKALWIQSRPTRKTNKQHRCLIFKMQRQHQRRSRSVCSGRSILGRQTIVISGVERCHSHFCLRNQFALPAPVTRRLWAARIFFFHSLFFPLTLGDSPAVWENCALRMNLVSAGLLFAFRAVIQWKQFSRKCVLKTIHFNTTWLDGWGFTSAMSLIRLANLRQDKKILNCSGHFNPLATFLSSCWLLFKFPKEKC